MRGPLTALLSALTLLGAREARGYLGDLGCALGDVGLAYECAG